MKPTIHILVQTIFCYSPSFRLRIFIGILLFCSTVFSPLVFSAPMDSLKVVNWNLEFFGDIASQRAKEMKGTRTIMNHLNADIYALEEVVNVDSLHSLVQSINGNYQYLISPFGSFASSPSSNDYASAQKLAFIYRSEKVRNVSGRPFLKNSVGNAYYNWSSGRYPYFISAEVKDNSNHWQQVYFVVIHAKAKSDNKSCMRRYEGGLEMKDSLDKHYPNEKIILLGDYNDDFDISICGGPSNYEYLVSDSFGSQYYYSPTLPLSRMGLSSIDGYPGFIDHVVISNEMINDYVAGSAKMLQNEVEQWIPNYTNEISDHYPVMTQYILTHPTTIPGIAAKEISLYPNPATNYLQLDHSSKAFTHYEICSPYQQKIAIGTITASRTTIALPPLANGIYYIRLTGSQTIIKEFIIQNNGY